MVTLQQIEKVKLTVGIYNSHETALDAIRVLKNKNYPVSKLSIIGKARIVVAGKQEKPEEAAENIKESAGEVLSSSLRVLSEAGVFAVSGFGFIFGAGAIRNSLAGFALGMAGAEIVTILNTIGIKKRKIIRYVEYLNEGKFLVIAQGNEVEACTAMNILSKYEKPFDLCVN
jgi:hypothetical protein